MHNTAPHQSTMQIQSTSQSQSTCQSTSQSNNFSVPAGGGAMGGGRGGGSRSKEHQSWSEQQGALRSQIKDQQARTNDQTASAGGTEQDRARMGVQEAPSSHHSEQETTRARASRGASATTTATTKGASVRATTTTSATILSSCGPKHRRALGHKNFSLQAAQYIRCLWKERYT